MRKCGQPVKSGRRKEGVLHLLCQSPANRDGLPAVIVVQRSEFCFAFAGSTVLCSVQYPAKQSFAQGNELQGTSVTGPGKIRPALMDDPSFLHYQHPIGQRRRFLDVMSHQHRRKFFTKPDFFDESLHFQARECIERTQRLVKQEDGCLAGQCSGQRDTLTLAAREYRGPIFRSLLQTNQFQQ